MPDQLATTMADVLGKGGTPALSATTDMPAFEQPQPADAAKATEAPAAEQAAETPADAAEPAAEAKAEETAAEPAAEAEAPAADAKPAKPKFSERISELTAHRKAAEQRADTLANSLEKALAAIDKLTVRPAEQTAPAAEPRPKRESFDNPDAYDEALVEWTARITTAKVEAEAEAKRLEQAAEDKRLADEQAQADRLKTLTETFAQRKAKAIEELPDYDEVVERDDLQISIPMSLTIMNAPNGPQIAYHLGKNPQEAARIAALEPALQIFELGQIAHRLAQPKPNVSKAPAPIKPLGSQAAAAAKSPEEESMEEYAARRTAQLRARR